MEPFCLPSVLAAWTSFWRWWCIRPFSYPRAGFNSNVQRRHKLFWWKLYLMHIWTKSEKGSDLIGSLDLGSFANWVVQTGETGGDIFHLRNLGQTVQFRPLQTDCQLGCQIYVILKRGLQERSGSLTWNFQEFELGKVYTFIQEHLKNLKGKFSDDNPIMG